MRFPGLLSAYGVRLTCLGAGHAYAGAGLSANAAVLIGALIGFVGAVLCGGVGGWLTIVATRRQFERDRQAAREDRSRAVAAALASEASRMRDAAGVWAKNHDHDALETAWFLFSREVVVQDMVLTDEAVGDRVNDYLELAGKLLDIAPGHTDTDLLRALGRHLTALLEALHAYAVGDPLPDYKPPPLNDLAALREWGREAQRST